MGIERLNAYSPDVRAAVLMTLASNGRDGKAVDSSQEALGLMYSLLNQATTLEEEEGTVQAFVLNPNRSSALRHCVLDLPLRRLLMRWFMFAYPRGHEATSVALGDLRKRRSLPGGELLKPIVFGQSDVAEGGAGQQVHHKLCERLLRVGQQPTSL